VGDMIRRRFSVNIGKKRVVIVGSGWGGFRLATDIDKQKNIVHVISPRNHFLFTPLLPSTTVGTLEFRVIQEPVRNIRGLHYEQASVDAIDFEKRTVECTDSFTEGHKFSLQYDVLVLACGSETATFGIRGIEHHKPRGTGSHVYFLKQLHHSRAIRDRLIECFERASSPGCSTAAEQEQLLTFAVVGGGPTNIEFASELYDFLSTDVRRLYPDLAGKAKVVLIEAGPKILGSFHTNIARYVEATFRQRKVVVLTGRAVRSVENDVALLDNGDSVPFGLMVWSAGNKQTSLTQSLPTSAVKKHPGNGRIVIDGSLRVLSPEGQPLTGVYALGDCAGDAAKPLPGLAQVASQQGAFLAKMLNSNVIAAPKTFQYMHLGAMMSVGNFKGVYDSTHIGTDSHHIDGPQVKGVLAFVLWRAAYWTKSVSIQNKILLAMYWFKSLVFGRDVSRF